MNYLFEIGGGIVIAFTVWFFYFRHWHFGNGMILAWNPDDGTVWVASRLVDSPAGRAGVQVQMKVLFVDGVPMVFQKGKTFEAWGVNTLSRRGKTHHFVFEDGPDVKITNVFLKGTAPVYWRPGTSFAKMENSRAHNPLLTQGMIFCEDTQQHVPSRGLTDDAIRSVSR